MTERKPGAVKGRPPKYEKERCCTIVLSLARKGKTNEQISEALGINQSTFVEWRKKYPEIAKALAHGRWCSVGRVEEGLYAAAKGMTVREVRTITSYNGKTRTEIIERDIPPDPRAAKILLSCWDARNYQDALKIQAELSGKEDGPPIAVILERIESRRKEMKNVDDNDEEK